MQDNLMVDVKKNRFDGSLGKVHLDFNPSALCFVEKVSPSIQSQQAQQQRKKSAMSMAAKVDAKV
jgi:hypothetical protein